jgi:hypothetical protein
MDKLAAISMDEIGERTLGEISAAEFLSALDGEGVALDSLATWPEKKKKELWEDTENYKVVRAIDIRDVLVGIRTEKKKVELEKHPGTETWQGPDISIYENVLERLARIEKKLEMI